MNGDVLSYLGGRAQSYVDVRRRRLDVVPFLEAPYLETRLNRWQSWWSASGVALCVLEY
jgi:hypothetical protein